MSLEPADARDGVRIVRATGEVDFATAPLVEQALTSYGPLVLDLTDVTFFDSAAVSMVDRLARSHAAQRSGFRVVAPPGSRGRRVLDIVGIGPGVVADTVDDAVAELR